MFYKFQQSVLFAYTYFATKYHTVANLPILSGSLGSWLSDSETKLNEIGHLILTIKYYILIIKYYEFIIYNTGMSRLPHTIWFNHIGLIFVHLILNDHKLVTVIIGACS